VVVKSEDLTAVLSPTVEDDEVPSEVDAIMDVAVTCKL
jgi:hypothetical protein